MVFVDLNFRGEYPNLRRGRLDRTRRGGKGMEKILAMAAVKTTWVESPLSCSLVLSGSHRFLQPCETSTSPTKTFRQS